MTPAIDLISGEGLCDLLGITAGALQHSDEGWLKYANGGTIDYVAKKTIRYGISWNDINAADAIFGDRVIEINGMLFAVRLLGTKEWDMLMYPVHEDFGEWAQFTDEDLLVQSSFGSGSYSWTSTTSGSNRIYRGGSGVAYSYSGDPSYAYALLGFRPVLTFLKTL